ncbi:methyltransferase domain-containing protein [Dankookia sp. GCM10030260]|uniref:methyltransferase domain-containing protein n=1 Tax=Dankookia sp. GCM10030260 TaxID=3273390 RepID=UPI0036D297CC
MTSAIAGQVAVEHHHRYLLAREHCRGRDVLDVAAGEGYGTALLSQVARSAIGVEIDPAAVAAAAREFDRPGLRYLVGDARAIPLADATVDVVVSFETLEHFDGQDRFLDECRRVLRPGGLLIISTPDRDVYSRPGTPPNPFHVRELDRPEFEAMLRARFANIAVAAQRPMIGSAIVGEGRLAPRVFDTLPGDRFAAADVLPDAPYLIAFASDAALPPPAASLLVLRDDLDTDPAARREAEARAAGLDRRLAEAERRAAASDASLAEAEARAAQSELRLIAFESSEVGRALRRLRIVVDRWPRTARLLRRGVMLAWWALRGQLPMRLAAWRRARRLRQDVAGGAFQAVIRDELNLPDPAARRPLPAPGAIRLPAAGEAPLVSILIPTYGQVDYTLRCLASIAAAPPRAGIEVIVAEDASGDPGLARLREVPGIVLRENPENLGFLRSCNAAAEAARGRFLLFLNNDTEVLPGAIDALADLALARPDAGLVGARLVYPDGRLQEAGGIVWQDASAWNYGRFQDPRRPEFNYVREVDYCSGAAILVRRDVFEQLGGFDEAFVPAYYEDTDLAFRIRAVGLRTLYQPAAVVVHHEGVSHGTDTESGIKAHQVANAAVMADRWRGVLQAGHYPNGEQVMRARDRAHGRPVVLVIDDKVLEPDRDAGSRSTFEHVRALLREGWVVKFWPDNGAAPSGYTAALQQMGVEVLHGPWSGRFADWIGVHGGMIDHVLLNRPHLGATYLPLIRAACRARVVFYGHDLHFARLRREAAVTGSALSAASAESMLQVETHLWRSCDTVLYPSEEEAAEVRRLSPRANVRAVTPYCFDAFPRPAAVPAATGGILFVAGFAHPPNVDAAAWLVREILPLVRAELPQARLTLAGSHPTSEVLALRGAGIEVTGAISAEDLAARYAAARLAVVPLRFGAGVKLKVVEALQQGLPLVTTPVGAQGLPDLAQILPVTGDAAAFAAAAVRLLRDDAAWMAQSAAQSAYAESMFSREALRESLLGAFGVVPAKTSLAA